MVSTALDAMERLLQTAGELISWFMNGLLAVAGMVTVEDEYGTLAGLQFPGVFQSVLVVPVQVTDAGGPSYAPMVGVAALVVPA